MLPPFAAEKRGRFRRLWDRLRSLEGALLPPFLLVAALMACKTGRIDIYTCPDPCEECEEPCACAEGTCVPVPPLGWEGPVLLWHGPPEGEPACPARAPAPVYEGHRGLKTIPECAQCACSPPTCQLPERVSASATSDVCLAGLETRMLPEGWDGACVEIEPLVAPESLRVGATSVGACEPVTITLQKASFGWETKAKGCVAAGAAEACARNHEVCAPLVETERDGFELCIYQRGDGRTESAQPGWGTSCPVGFPQVRVFYGGVADDSTCMPCSCGEPEGSACDGRMMLHEGSGCQGGRQEMLIGLDGGSCTAPSNPIPEIWSVEAALVLDEPGSCKPAGGQLVNGGVLLEPATFCCR
ncbi:hypothetical protein [Chondromyces crocatus]|uniref:Uncharacterized protein n=1 Tax=Chondromyces crocatus TaxID=52 RepID=A0A0K1EEF3_CHOCO|nr:hypothetical protein [Chondromyces crocatus]AKT39250.1 uncharacterized protein CMC5_033980 [Chondromyces crocatus]